MPLLIAATSENSKNATHIPAYFLKECPHAILSKEEKKALVKLFAKAQEMPAAQQIKQILKTPRQNQLVKKK
jgi:hypothetical protein